QDPAWVSYEPCALINGAKPVLVDSTKHDLHFTPEAVAGAITPKTKMIIVNTPSNPTGVVMSESELRGIADLAKDHDLIVLADEIYQKILYEGQHHSIASFDGMFERTITINGLSKAYAMTGWRAGWLVAPQPLFKEISKVQQHSITCIPPFIQIAGIYALKVSAEDVKFMSEKFRSRRNLMLNLLNELKKFKCSKPEGAFYLFPRFESSMNSMDFAGKLLTEAKVAVTPGSAFGPSVDNYLRFSYAASREVIKDGIGRIREVEDKGLLD
ncbi:MAG: aminotransferase class I/II-fold pyridoxal phosphate-dependent enzyme, partial [Thermoplasmata archaeon]|nr:aminotransferase class I/II-fold pyridoxal phosphate-dependent enzyme [Thermoplasmata archaeon]